MNNTHSTVNSIDEDISIAGRQQLAIDRTLLANERTMLAYTRTSLALIGLGAFIIHFNNEIYSFVLGLLLFLIAAVYLIVGTVKYRRYDARIRSEKTLLNIEACEFIAKEKKT